MANTVSGHWVCLPNPVPCRVSLKPCSELGHAQLGCKKDTAWLCLVYVKLLGTLGVSVVTQEDALPGDCWPVLWQSSWVLACISQKKPEGGLALGGDAKPLQEVVACLDALL